MEGRKRSRKNTRQEWKRRVSSALAVVLMVLTTIMIVLYRRITNVKELEGIG